MLTRDKTDDDEDFDDDDLTLIAAWVQRIDKHSVQCTVSQRTAVFQQ